ncbi:MptD family putative ECF transporter S component [Streptococcus loxodontisalivarius]|uniref:Energy-coupling factor transport system substrate-specific component n=1 Tax=Streptococcus loxodontisalivarius TaxID=1349415 RepID=A0ABS2PP82_9STRE|nr:energy-coupling factor transport system substrate-specific component [Streptococcus loxodontisalivarius]
MIQKQAIKTTALHSLYYFLCVCLAVLIDLFIIGSRNMYYTPGMAAFFSGFVYMRLIKKTKAFGAITILGIVMSAFFFASGHFVWAFLPNLLCGLLADYVASQGKYENTNLNLTSFILFSFGNLAPILTMWIAPKQYVAQLLAEGKTQDYVNAVMVPFDLANVGFSICFIILMAALGGLIGQKYQK